MFDHATLRDWLPAKQVICEAGLSDTVFDQRMIAKLLQDLEVLPQIELGEPFGGALLHQQVCMEGTAMHRCPDNGVDPESLISEVGADAVRHGVLNAASPRKAFDWSNQSVRHAVRFLETLWRYAEPRLRGWSDSAIDEINEADRLRRSLSKWCQIGLQKITADYEALEMQRAIYNIARLFARIQDFEQRAYEQRGELESADRDAVVAALMLLIQVLAPVTPHIAEELWLRGGGDGLVSTARWPYAGNKL
jgi:leucyl-tRNA synthetase